MLDKLPGNKQLVPRDGGMVRVYKVFNSKATRF